MEIPAICDRCGSTFSSGIEVAAAIGETLDGRTVGPCPVCDSATGTIPEGTTEIVHGVLGVLAAGELDHDALAALAVLLADEPRSAREPIGVAHEISRIAPALGAGLGRVARPRTLAVCATLMIAVVQWPNAAPRASPRHELRPSRATHRTNRGRKQ